MVDLSRHPILRQCYDLSIAIEECGASVELTNAVTKSSELMNSVDKLLNEIDAAREDIRNWKAEVENRGAQVKGMLQEESDHRKKVLELYMRIVDLKKECAVRNVYAYSALEEVQQKLQSIYLEQP